MLSGFRCITTPLNRFLPGLISNVAEPRCRTAAAAPWRCAGGCAGAERNAGERFNGAEQVPGAAWRRALGAVCRDSRRTGRRASRLVARTRRIPRNVDALMPDRLPLPAVRRCRCAAVSDSEHSRNVLTNHIGRRLSSGAASI